MSNTDFTFGLTSVTYPSYLADSKYANNKITLYACTSPYTNTDSTNAWTKALNAQGINRDINKISDPDDASLATYERGELVAAITLPLPNQISDSQDHQWDCEKGLVGTLYQTLGGANVANYASSKILASNSNSLIGKALKNSGDFNLDKSWGYLAMQTGFRKPTPNPGYWQNYVGSTPRRFVMTFDFVPKNQQDAKEIRRLILMLKKYSSPSKLELNDVVLLAPYYFDIKISNQMVSDLFNMRSVVITNMQCDYGADGSMQVFQDGFPKHITMTLQMCECSVALADNYENAYSRTVGEYTDLDNVLNDEIQNRYAEFVKLIGGKNEYENMKTAIKDAISPENIAQALGNEQESDESGESGEQS